MQLFEEATIGGVTLKNRIVRSATFEGAADANGMPTEALGRMYKQLAEHGVGAIISGFAYVRRDGRAMHPGQVGCDADEKVLAFLPITQMVHGYGCRIFMQLAHTGRQTLRSATGERPMGVSSKKSAYFNQRLHVLATDEVHGLADAFGDAAVVAKKAGFDGVQLHAAHGYLIHQFLHPCINNRRDEFGIDPETGIGTAFLRMVIDGVRAKCGTDFPVLVKISASDDLARPFTDAQFLHLIGFLEQMRVDAVEISYGTMELPFNIFRGGFPVDDIFAVNGIYKNRPAWVKWAAQRMVFPLLKRKCIPFAPMYNLPYARLARSKTNIPIMVVGGFRDRSQMEHAVGQCGMDFVSLCRPLIAEPDFVSKILRNAAHQSTCVNCNRCAVWCDSGKPTRCRHRPERPNLVNQ